MKIAVFFLLYSGIYAEGKKDIQSLCGFDCTYSATNGFECNHTKTDDHEFLLAAADADDDDDDEDDDDDDDQDVEL